MFKKNAINITYQAVAQIIPRAMMLVFMFYLARILGSEEYGKFEFSMTLGYMIGMFFELGGNMILTKHVSRSYYSSINYAIKIRLISILSALLIFYIILFSFDLYPEIRLYIVYANLGIAFSSLMNLYFAFFRGVRKMQYEAFVLIFQKIIFIILALALLYYDKSGSRSLFAFMISMVIGFLLIFSVYKKQENHYREKDKKESISFTLYAKDVVSLAMVEIIGSLYFRLNQILIEHFRGFTEVGIYGISYKVIEVFLSFPSILLIALFPAFAKIAIEDKIQFRKHFNTVLVILFSAGLMAGIISWIFGDMVFSIIGSEYEGASVLLRYLTIPLLFMFPNFLVTQGLIALDKNSVYAKILFIVLFLNILISYILVPKYGAYGSAVSIGICEFIIFISGYYFIRISTGYGYNKA